MTWTQAIGSTKVDLLHPTPEQIDFRTIATVLARVPRFGGHTEEGTISVAQHCREGALAILRDTGRRDWAFAFLLHDAHEAYIGDITTPVQEALCALADEEEVAFGGAGNLVKGAIRELKGRLDEAIYTKAGIAWPLDTETARVVREYDIRMCRTERDARLATPPFDWGDIVEQAEPVKGCDLEDCSAEVAAWMWLIAKSRLRVDSTHKAR